MKRLLVFLFSTVLVVSGCSLADPMAWFLGGSPAPSASSAPSASLPVTPVDSPAASTLPASLPPATPKPTPVAVAPGGLLTLKVGQRDLTPGASAADVRQLVKGNTAFALDLYDHIRTAQPGNLVFGPYSISVAFGMQHAGALGTTAAQIENVMHFTIPTDRLDQAFNALSLQLASRVNPKLQLSVVNRLFGAQLFDFKRDYLREVTQQFAAPMAALDFKGDPEAARQLINAWVAGQTDQLIKGLIPRNPQYITQDTMLVLANAMYLNARWSDPFDPNNTFDGPFRLATGKTVTVKTMRQGGCYQATDSPAYKAVEVPYAGGQLAMDLVMPRDIGRFEGSLTPASLQGILDGLKRSCIDFSMPKFSIRTATALSDTLKAMGMRAPFSRTAADFYGISDYPRSDVEHRLHISAVLHQAVIKVAEKGTEAAAATAIIDQGGGGGEPPPSINIDHPFVWLIRDRDTGTILFMGRVMDPSQTAK